MYGIEKVYIYHILTTGDIIFKIITLSKVYKRFDTSHEYCERFLARKGNLKKKLGYFVIEHIDDPCILTIACNPKEYFEMFEDKNINKKHKGIKKGFSGLCFENFLTE